MMRIVIDTSVLIRYLIKPSAAIRELIEVHWLGDHLEMVTAPELLAELESVLARPAMRAFIVADEGATLTDAIRLKAEMLAPLGAVPAFTRDHKDDKFVACALAGQAAYLVTVDNDLLTLGRIGDVGTVTPHDLIAILRHVG